MIWCVSIRESYLRGAKFPRERIQETAPLRADWPTRVDQALAFQGRSRTWLAGRLGMERSNLSRYLLGYYAPSVDLLERIAEALDIAPELLYIADGPVNGHQE